MLHVNHPWEFKGEDSEGYTLVVTDESVNLLASFKMCVKFANLRENVFILADKASCYAWAGIS